MQLPAPLHVEGGETFIFPLQEAGAQGVPAA
jgi:hypothetical protein